MKVFKFGGASVRDADGVRNVAGLLSRFGSNKIMVVVSAMGKTTNQLEALVDAYYHSKGDRFAILQTCKEYHLDIVRSLFEDSRSPVYNEVENLFLELECLMEDKLRRDAYDFVYDQLICYGELLATKIVSYYLLQSGIRNQWVDARNFILTDSTFREGRIQWQETEQVVVNRLKPFLEKSLVVTQGFIGRDRNNQTTTLGREGSDYTAAIFAWCLGAESVTIWKDVAGVMNADPKRFDFAKRIAELSYANAIELAYYGASVIHPKTIQPLQNRGIPLYVRSFIHPDEPGTVVSNTPSEELELPCFIVKEEQAIVHITSIDFSFIAEDHLRDIFGVLAELRIKLNLMQNSAISFSFGTDFREERLQQLKERLSGSFDLEYSGGLKLLTVYNPSGDEDRILSRNKILLHQEMGRVVQYLVEPEQ